MSRRRRPPKGLSRAACREENATVLLQAAVRHWSARRRLKSCLALHRYRSRVVKETLNTEQTFVHVLESLVHRFVEPLRKQELLSEAEQRAIFSNVEIIAGINKALLEDMQTRVDTWNVNQLFGVVFLQITDFLKVYIDYVKNYDDAVRVLETAKKENPEFKSFLKEQMRRVKGYERDDLISLLITPVQRIPRYNLLLRDLLKHTWKWHPDYANIQLAQDKVQKTAKVVNDKATEAVNQSKVYNLQSMMTGKFEDLVSPNRRLVRDGELRLLQVEKKKRRLIYCMLFNDLVVCCKNETSKWRGTRKLEFVKQVPLAGATLVQLRNDTSGNALQNAFSVETRKAKVLLQAETEEERREWMTDLEAMIVETNANLSRIDEQKGAIAEQKAAEARALIAEKYTSYRVDGMAEEEKEEKKDGSQSGMRKFAKKRNDTLNLSMIDKFQRKESAEMQTEQLLQKEKSREDRKRADAQAKAQEFKQSASKKYKDKPKTRKFTLTRRQGHETAQELADIDGGNLTPVMKAAVAKQAIREKYSSLKKSTDLAAMKAEAEEAEGTPRLRKWARK